MTLPPRQFDVIQAVSQGDADKQIARELGISVHTVRGHIRAAMLAFGVKSRIAAACAFIRRKPERGLAQSN